MNDSRSHPGASQKALLASNLEHPFLAISGANPDLRKHSQDSLLPRTMHRGACGAEDIFDYGARSQNELFLKTIEGVPIKQELAELELLRAKEELLKQGLSSSMALRSYRAARCYFDQQQRRKSFGQFFRVQLKESVLPRLPGNVDRAVLPEFSESEGLIVHLMFSEKGKKDPFTLLEQAACIKQIYGQYYSHPAEWAEVVINAQYGSERAKTILAEAEAHMGDALAIMLQSHSLDGRAYATAKDHQGEVGAAAPRLAQAAEQMKRNVLSKKWSRENTRPTHTFQHLEQLIANNKRDAVADLLEACLPWEDMDPAEISTWHRWVQAMRKPVNPEAALTFRGIGDGPLHRCPGEGAFLLSRRLERNDQGEPLNRLSTYYSDLYRNEDNRDPIKKRSLLDLLKGHSAWARFPTDSPLMSTSSFKISRSGEFSFARGQAIFGMTALRLNPERMFPNIANAWEMDGKVEEEFLVPLLIFPDEVVHVAQQEQPKSERLFKKFLATVEEKIGRPTRYGEQHGSKNGTSAALNKMIAWWRTINPETIDLAQAGERTQEALGLFRIP